MTTQDIPDTTMAIFERCAAGELTPEEAATELLAADKARWDAKRPLWIPQYMWSAAFTMLRA